jgi:uncharacterized protein with HEPN domain
MTKHDDFFYIEGLKEHIAAIRSYLPADKESFLSDGIVQDAILMRLLAMGEEIGKLSEDFKDEHSDLSWYKIIGLRNRIAHEYRVVDQDVIWEIINGGELDDLERAIDQMLE